MDQNKNNSSKKGSSRLTVPGTSRLPPVKVVSKSGNPWRFDLTKLCNSPYFMMYRQKTKI